MLPDVDEMIGERWSRKEQTDFYSKMKRASKSVCCVVLCDVCDDVCD